MSAFDNTIQKQIPLAGARMETGRVAASGVSGFTFNVASKFKKVICGHGVMEGDGLVAYPATGTVSNGQVSWTRVGAIETSADYLQYTLIGF